MTRSQRNRLLREKKKMSGMRISSFILVLLLLLSTMPFSTFAGEEAPQPEAVQPEESVEEAESVPPEEEPEEPGEELQEEHAHAADITAMSEIITFDDPVITPSRCTAPAYCSNGDCTCASDPESCICPDDCLCRVYRQSACITPNACTNSDCKCKPDGADTCICDADCKCRFPDFQTSTVTTVADANPKTGKATQVSVNINVNTNEAVFEDIRIKTYVEESIRILPLDIDGIFSVDGEITREQVDGVWYNVISLTAPISGSAGGYFDFDVIFPAGVTPNGTKADVFTIVEGVVKHTDHGSMTFGKEQNDTIEDARITAQAVATTWDVAITNTALDYKNEINQNNIFRQKIELSRTPPGTEGVYFLKENGTEVTITLPGEIGNAEMLRITRGDGTAVPFSASGDGRTITIAAADVPGLNFDGDGFSSASSAVLYMVFELQQSYLDANAPSGGLDEFLFYENIKTKVDFSYQTVMGADADSADEGVQILSYNPSGGDGPIGKSAVSPFIEGQTFYSNVQGTMTPISYNIGFTNNTNTPIRDFMLVDAMPELFDMVGGTASDAGVPQGSVLFHQFTLTRLSAGNSTATVTFYDAKTGGSAIGTSQAVTLNQTVNVPTGTYRIELSVDGIVEYGDRVSATVTVLGNPSLAGDKTTRDKIKFVRNTARYSGFSTKGSNPAVGGGDSATVHVYPFDDAQDPKKVWNLAGAISAEQSSNYVDKTTISRGSDVYYRLDVSPKNAEQFVYSPVFFLELPPEVLLADESNPAANVTLSGAANIAGYTVELIEDNPFGVGSLLKISSNGKQLLNPSGSGAVTVHCKVNPDASQGATVVSNMYFGIEDEKTPLDVTDGFVTAGVENDIPAALGVTTLELLQSSATLVVRGSGLLEGELSVQTEFDRDTGAWHRHPEVAKALPGGQLYYKFNVRNGGNLDAENIVLYNVFSNVNDTFIVGNSARGSEWKPYLTGPVTVPGATVYYSEYDDHKVTMSGVYSGTDDWTATPYSYPAVKSLKIEFDSNYVLPSGDAIEIVVPMYAPTDYAVETNKGNTAISSLATQFNFEGSAARTMALEPLRVMVEMLKNEKGEISGKVWGDGDGILKNGAQDDLGVKEFVEADVEVMLFKENGGNYEYMFSTKTDNAGTYKFTNLDQGTYQIRVKLPTGYEAGVAGTHNKFAAAESTGTYPGTADSYSYVANLNDYPVNLAGTKVYANVDAAIYPKPTTITGTVWRSIDGLSARDADSATKDTGLVGVDVTLYRIISGSERINMQTVQSQAGGTYTFTNVPAGRYVVVFGTLTNYTYVTRTTTTPTVTGKPTLPNVSQAADKGENGYVKGQSYEIWLAPDTPQTGVDCGLKPAAGSISGNIWVDTNGNMVKDGGEAGLNGTTATTVKVALVKTAGYNASATEIPGTVDAGGNFKFEGLTPGTYSVVYTDTNVTADARYFVSYHVQAGGLSGTQVAEVSRVASHTFAGITIEPSLGADGKDVQNNNIGVVKKLTVSGSVFNDKNSSNTFNSGTDVKLDTTGIVIARTAGGDATTPSYTVNTTGGDYSRLVWPGTYTVTFPNSTGIYKDQASNTVENNEAGGVEYNDYLVMTKNSGTFSRTDRKYTLSGLTANRTDVNLAFVRPRSIEGSVWHDKDGDGEVTASLDTYLNPGRTLTIAAVADTGAETPATLTDVSDTSDGTYDFTRLYPGTYTVTVTRDSYVVTNHIGNSDLTDTGVYTIVISAADTGAAADPKNNKFGLALPVTVTGMAWLDKEMSSADHYVHNGIYDGGTDALFNQSNIAVLYRHDGTGYKPWNGTEYKASAADALKAATTSGVYAFAPQIPGVYKVVLTPAADYFVSGPALAKQAVANPSTEVSNGNAAFTMDDTKGEWQNIVLHSGEAFTATTDGGLNLSVGKYISISGVVYHDLNGDGVKDGSPEGVYTSTATSVQLQRKSSSAVYVNEGNAQATVSGAYSFKVKPGEYQVVFNQNAWRVTNAGGDLVLYEPETLANRTATWQNQNYISADAANIVNKDFLISIYSGISGNVWVDKDANAAKDAGELAKTGAVVTLTYEASGLNDYTDWFNNTYPDANKTQTIAAEGTYSFPDLWPGTYYVTLAGADGYLRTNASSDTNVTAVSETDKRWKIVVTSHSTVQAVNFGLVMPSTLSGEVWNDADNDKTNNSEAAIGTVTVTRNNVAGNMTSYTKTSAAGAFTFDDLLPGSYTVTANLPSSSTWLKTYLAANANLSVSSGGTSTIAAHADMNKYIVTIADSTGDGVTVANASAGYAKQSTIGGLVFDDLDNDDVQDAGENPIAGVKATLVRLNNDNSVDGTFPVQEQTGSSYSFSGLLPGKYKVTLAQIAANYLTTTPDGKSAAALGASASFAKASREWTVTILADDQTIELKTGVVAQKTISGTVWQDIDASKTYNNSEPYFTPGVTVKLYQNSVQVGIATTTSTADGTYSFTGLYPGTYTVEITKPLSAYYASDDVNCTELATDLVTRTVAVTTADVASQDFPLSRKISITGRVWKDKDATGANGAYDTGVDEPQGSAVVSLLTGTGSSITTTTTNANGSYFFAGLAPGTYRVELLDTTFNGYAMTNSMTATGDYAADSFGGSVALAAENKRWTVVRYDGHAQQSIDFGLSDRSVVRVKVWTDANGDGTENAGEAVRAGVPVKILGKVSGNYTNNLLETTTDQYGYVTLTDVELGDYRIEVAPGTGVGVTNTAGNAEYQEITVSRYGTVELVEFGLAEYVTFSGQVWTELDGNGQYTSGGQGEAPAASHSVEIKRGVAVVGAVTQTGAEGTFAITAAHKVLPGSFTVAVAGMSGCFVTNTGAEFDADTRVWTFSLTNGGNKSALNCGFTPKRTITGDVWIDSDTSKDKNGSEDYLTGKTVTLWKLVNGTYVDVTGCVDIDLGVNGDFSFADLWPGEYKVTVDCGSDAYLRTNPQTGQDVTCTYAEYSFGAADGVQLAKDEKIGLVQPVSISGRAFLDKDSDGAYSASVDAGTAVMVKIERTDVATSYPAFAAKADGTYSTSHLNLLPGDYTVQFAEVSGHVASNADVEFDDGTRTWAFTLAPGTARGNVDIGYKRTDYIITGLVFEDVDGNGVRNGGERVFNSTDNITVVAEHPVHGSLPAVTVQDDGTFTIPVDNPGEYILKATLPSGYVVTLRTAVYDREKDEFKAPVTYKNSAVHVEFGAAKSVRITGMMWMDLNANGLYEPSLGEEPLANAIIHLVPHTGVGPLSASAMWAMADYVEEQTTTDAQGNYIFPAVKPGCYVVQLAQLPGNNHYYTGYNGDDAPDVSVCSFHARNGQWMLTVTDSHVDNANSGYHDPSEISGVLLDRTTGDPVGGQVVQLQKKDANGQYVLWDEAVTDAQGNYLFDYLIAGEYRVVVTIPDGYNIHEGSSGVQQGTTIIIEVVLNGMGQSVSDELGVLKPMEEGNGNTETGTETGNVADAGAGTRGGSARTGDESNMALWILLAAAAGIVISGGLIYLRRRKEE